MLLLRRVSIVEAEIHLADLLTKINDREISIVIEREGRPIAALVSLEPVMDFLAFSGNK